MQAIFFLQQKCKFFMDLQIRLSFYFSAAEMLKFFNLQYHSTNSKYVVQVHLKLRAQ